MANGDVTLPAGSPMFSEDEDGNITLNASVLSAVAQAAKHADKSGCGPCAPARPICDICWGVSPNELVRGESITITVLGAPSGYRAGFEIICADGSRYVTNIVTDSKGRGQKRIALLNGSGVYTVRPVACGDCCVYTPGSVCVKVAGECNICPEITVSTNADDCDLTTSNVFSGGAIYSSACDAPVTVAPRFMSPTVASGGQVQLELAVTNFNYNSVQFSLSPIALPAGLSGTVVIPNTTLLPNQTARFYFTLTASAGVDTNAQVLVGNNLATYICSGEQYSASGGQDGVLIQAPSGNSCDLRIESFTWNPDSILNGGLTQLQLVLKNYGSTSVTGVSMTAVSGGGGFTGAALVISGVTIAPGATHTVSSTGTINHSAGTAQVFAASIPSGHISYVCDGTSKLIAGVKQVNISVAASTISTGYCSGVLSWRFEQGVGSNGIAIPMITGGLPNTTYNYVVSGVMSFAGQMVTDSSGNAEFDINYDAYQNFAQVIVTVSGPAPGNCQFPELSITLPDTTVSEGS